MILFQRFSVSLSQPQFAVCGVVLIPTVILEIFVRITKGATWSPSERIRDHPGLSWSGRAINWPAGQTRSPFAESAQYRGRVLISQKVCFMIILVQVASQFLLYTRMVGSALFSDLPLALIGVFRHKFGNISGLDKVSCEFTSYFVYYTTTPNWLAKKKKKRRKT